VFRTILNPGHFHGLGKQPPFFEGWYFKLVDKNEGFRYAVIPGVFIGEDPHAFIQVLDGNRARSRYFRFDFESFKASDNAFEISIGNNRFSETGLVLDIAEPEGVLSGEVGFDGLNPWPVSLASPGAMGWYAWLPFMQCYHGVLSLDHGLRGGLDIDGRTIDFTGGRGYIEKDWGKAFPQGYVWFQSNHFAARGTSVFGSIAVIPWLGRAFRGFIIGLWHDGKLFRFATHTGARLEHLEIGDETLEISVRSRRHRLRIVARRAQGGLLHEPTGASMLQRVEETMLATVAVTLSEIDGDVLLEQEGRNAGLEVQGNLDMLLALR
jgi:hypothetical protein